ncbi:aminotransferase class IV [Subtercola endophyticus]|uniref:aminotransferase class IV n=1 Tax=Subtercola endophyticus TaxID=2895559 RepID=UPI001E471BFD|nr:aminotransferase class IV [Subtercola endophyticus]UFS60761.1 aminotransferase class IV [Subtercola endophyticus]
MTDDAPEIPTERRFVFRDGAFQQLAAVPDARQRLLAADSWLVDEGRVRAIDLHRDRFVGSALVSGFGDRAQLDLFWQATLDAIPPIHRWFPRVELSSRHELSLLMRLAPAPAATAVLATHLGEEPRGIPSVKGPDLERLTALRNTARASGVDDLVLLTTDGRVIDGTTTAIVWWRDGALRMPSADLARVDSVTARTIRVLALASGVEVAEERATPTDLRGCEVWAVNALYGIRLVTEWRGGPPLSTDPARSRAWRRRLDALAKPLAGS